MNTVENQRSCYLNQRSDMGCRHSQQQLKLLYRCPKSQSSVLIPAHVMSFLSHWGWSGQRRVGVQRADCRALSQGFRSSPCWS